MIRSSCKKKEKKGKGEFHDIAVFVLERNSEEKISLMLAKVMNQTSHWYTFEPKVTQV